MTGTWISATDATSPEYWTRHLRQPVRFSDGVQELLKESGRVFLEVGPGRTLASLVRQQGALAAGQTVATTLRHPQETTADLSGVLQTLGRLWLAGLTVDWAAFFAGQQRRRVTLPTYPFERKRYWIDARAAEGHPTETSRRRLVKNPDRASWFYAPAWTRGSIQKQQSDGDANGPWLAFVEDLNLGTQLVERLRHDGQTVVSVHPGGRFATLGPDAFVLDPAAPGDYSALVAELAASGRFPRRVVHMWTLGPTPASARPEEAFARAQDRGFFSVLSLVQAFGRHDLDCALDLTIIGDELRAITPGDVVSPEKSPVLGLCR